MNPLRTFFSTLPLFFTITFPIILASSLEDLPLVSYENRLVRDEQKWSNSYRSRTDDSFGSSAGRLAGESKVQLECVDGEGDFFCVPLTIESLSKLQERHSMASTAESASPSWNELLHIKRSSSMKSLSDATTEIWFIPSTQNLSLFVPPVPEAPTDSNSTVTSSVNSTAQIPANLKRVLKVSGFTESLLECLRASDLVRLFASNSAMANFLKDHVRASFNSEFPSLKGISRSIFRLILLRKLLNDPHMKFTNWHHFVHPTSAVNLHLFINDRLANATGAAERFALVDFIEFARTSELTSHTEQLPKPLDVFFTNEWPSVLEFKTKLKSIVMKASQHGHLRLLVALYGHIKSSFPKSIAGQFIVDIFLLGSEPLQGIQWTALQRSVLAPSTNVANFLLKTLTEDEDVLKAHFARAKSDNIKCNLPGFWERLMFPMMARKKIKRALQLEMVKAAAHKQVRAVHLAISKAKSPPVVSLFLSWERELVQSNFANPGDVQVFHLLAYGSKSLQTLRLVKEFFPANFPPEVSFKSDWPAGFNQFFSDKNEIGAYISGKNRNRLLHMLAYHGSSNILEYLLYKEFMTRSDLLDLSEIIDEDGRKPLQIALEREQWEVVKLLIRRGVRHDKHFLARVLDVNPRILNDILPDRHDREILAFCYTADANSHVTLLEWSIISKNQEALTWFLANLPIEHWRKFDGAGNTPVHLAVLLGNSEAIKLMLRHYPSLLAVLNYRNDTPMQVACRIRDKTRSRDKIEVVNEVIAALSEAAQEIEF